MAGEFFLPNFTMSQPGYSYGQGAGSPLAFNVPAPVTGLGPDQLRLAQIGGQMQPNTFLPYLGAGIQGLNTLGNLFFGWQGLRQAGRDSAWQRDLAEKNYWNSVRSYNTAMGDRVRSQYSPESAERNSELIDAEIQRRSVGGR